MPFKLINFGLVLFLTSCAKEAALLRVDSFKMHDTELANTDAEMVRGDQSHLLYGKLSKQDREQTIGHYLTARRKNTGEAAGMRLLYQQVRTGSKKLRKEVSLEPEELIHEFNISGDDYKKGGRILAWRLELINKAGQVLDSKQSYLWQ